MTNTPPPYTVIIDNRHRRQLRDLSPRLYALALVFLNGDAKTTPTTYVPGKVVQLRGDRSHLWEFKLDRSYRIVYEVDEATRQVLVQYIGPHPD